MGRDRVITDTMHLVTTAFSIIDEGGYEHFSARKLAEILGVSHMTVYNYMGRDQLLGEVITLGFSRLTERILPHVERCKAVDGGPCCIFSRIAEELFDFATLQPNMYRFMFQNRVGFTSEDPRVRGLYTSGVEMIQDAIPTDRREAVRADSYLFLVLVNGLILGYLDQRHGVTEEECRARMRRAYELILGPHSVCL